MRATLRKILMPVKGFFAPQLILKPYFFKHAKLFSGGVSVGRKDTGTTIIKLWWIQ